MRPFFNLKFKSFPVCSINQPQRYFSGTTVKHNIVSSCVSLPPIKGVTIPELLWDRIKGHEKEIAFSCATSDTKYTHGDIYKFSRGFATALQQAGLKQRDAVCIALPNIPEFPIACVGIWEAGLVTSSINPIYTPDEFAKQLLACNAKAIISIPKLVPTIRQAKEKCPQLKLIIVIGDAPEGCHSFFQMINVKENSAGFLKGSKIDTMEEIATIPFSSGTTGPPKGVMLTHSNVTTNLVQVCHPEFALGTTNERYIGVLPFFHAFGSTCLLLGTIYQRFQVQCIPKFEPQIFLKVFKEYKPTVAHLVTPLIMFLVNSPDLTKEHLAPLKGVCAGAAPIGLALTQKLLEKCSKDFMFQEGYGMTECNTVSHVTAIKTKNSKLGSCGALVPGTTGKLVCVESGKIVGTKERGELCIKGPQVMKGYLNNQKATDETVDKDQWLHTGDIAYYDEQGCFFIVERLKELIKVKGLQVAPSELEDLLRKIPGVGDVAVIGIPDDRAGELPRAYIVKSNSSLKENAIHDFLEKKVAPHKKLKGGIEFIDVIPKAASGKILHRILKQDYLKKAKK